MIVMMCGSRDGYDETLACDEIKNILMKYDITLDVIIHGGAIGIDSMVEKTAKSMGFSTVVYKPDYYQYKVSAPLIRNVLMINKSHKRHAFWNGTSHGTKFVIDYCKKHGLSIDIKNVAMVK